MPKEYIYINVQGLTNLFICLINCTFPRQVTSSTHTMTGGMINGASGPGVKTAGQHSKLVLVACDDSQVGRLQLACRVLPCMLDCCRDQRQISVPSPKACSPCALPTQSRLPSSASSGRWPHSTRRVNVCLA